MKKFTLAQGLCFCFAVAANTFFFGVVAGKSSQANCDSVVAKTR